MSIPDSCHGCPQIAQVNIIGSSGSGMALRVTLGPGVQGRGWLAPSLSPERGETRSAKPGERRGKLFFRWAGWVARVALGRPQTIAG